MNLEVNLVKQNPRTAVVLSMALITVLVVGTLLFAMVGGEDMPPSPSNNISAHVLDISTGQPAKGVNCTAYKHKEGDQWLELGTTTTDAQGRIALVHPNVSLSQGTYKLHFVTQTYFQLRQQSTFYPFIEVVFVVDDVTQHYHIPITLSNFGYSTYKGQ